MLINKIFAIIEKKSIKMAKFIIKKQVFFLPKMLVKFNNT